MIRALMLDVDGVLVRGRPEDGLNWATDLERDLGVNAADLQREFFARHWDEIIVGRADLPERLAASLTRIAPHVACDRLIAYWFENDSRLAPAILDDIAASRSDGLKVWLATNQEHMRAAYLMNVLGLAKRVDGMFYSAALGCRKPEGRFFRAIEAATGFAPEELLLVDDTPANVDAANEAKWHAVPWTRGLSLSAILAGFR